MKSEWRSSWISGICVALSVVCLFGGGRLLTAAEYQPTAEEKQVLEQAQVASKASVVVAKMVRPAVVNIRAERTQRVASSDVNDPFSLFNDEFSRRFFGRMFPQTTREVPVVGQGSGVIVDPKGYILTNNHVVGGADNIVVKLCDGREFPAELVGTSPESDIAVLRIEASNILIAELGDSDVCEVGSWVMAIGNPFGLDSTVTTGIVSAKGRSGVRIVEYEDFIQTDAAINPGNSGGPLVNLSGEVIGINTAILSKSGGYQGVGLAVPINIARAIMNGIIAHKKAVTSYLGVRFQDLTQELVESFGLKTPRGALIAEVLADTPAAKAGLKSGDVVIRYRGRDITDSTQLRTLVATTQPGESVEIDYYRGGKVEKTTVTVEAVPEKVTIARRSVKVLDALGVLEVSAMTDEIRQKFGYGKEVNGVVVVSIKRGSQAHSIGLAPGSVILKINETAVTTSEELQTAVGSVASGDPLDLTWLTGRFLRRLRMQFDH